MALMVMLLPVMAYDARHDDCRFHDDGAPVVATMTMTEILIATTKMNTIIMSTPFSPPGIVDVGDDLGVDHCGTTSLHRHLSEHPSIVPLGRRRALMGRWIASLTV